MKGTALLVTSPNGGETVGGGATWDITWQHSGDVEGNVDIELSVDNGASWSELASGVPNNGSWTWAVLGDE